MFKISRVFVAVAGILVMALMLGAAQQTVAATSVSITQESRYMQDSLPIATDFHYTAYVVGEEYWIIDWSIIQSSFPNQEIDSSDGGYGDGRIREIIVNFSGAEIPYGDVIIFTTQFILYNGCNVVLYEHVVWTHDGDTVPSIFPDYGFEVKEGVYYFYNNDDSTIEVSNFDYALNQGYMRADSLFEWSGWTDTLSDFVIAPHDTFSVSIADIEPGQFLYAKYDVHLSDGLVAKVTNLHQEPDTTVALEEEASETPRIVDMRVTQFEGAAEIVYSIPQATHTVLNIYSSDGRKVKTLVNEHKSAGTFTITWNGTDESGMKVAPGVYFCRLQVGDIIKAQKAIRLK